MHASSTDPMGASKRPRTTAREQAPARVPVEARYWNKATRAARNERAIQFHTLLGRVDRVQQDMGKAFPGASYYDDSKQRKAMLDFEALGAYARRWERHARGTDTACDEDHVATDSDDPTFAKDGKWGGDGPNKTRYYSDFDETGGEESDGSAGEAGGGAVVVPHPSKYMTVQCESQLRTFIEGSLVYDGDGLMSAHDVYAEYETWAAMAKYRFDARQFNRVFNGAFDGVHGVSPRAPIKKGARRWHVAFRK